jgi:hypothetical protein
MSDTFAKRPHRDAAEMIGKRIEPLQRALQQGCAANQVVSLQVMESCGDLNESLKESLFWILALKPDGFPVLMGEKELLGAVTAQTLSEFSLTPIERHDLIIIQD